MDLRVCQLSDPETRITCSAVRTDIIRHSEASSSVCNPRSSRQTLLVAFIRHTVFFCLFRNTDLTARRCSTLFGLATRRNTNNNRTAVCFLLTQHFIWMQFSDGRLPIQVLCLPLSLTRSSYCVRVSPAFTALVKCIFVSYRES